MRENELRTALLISGGGTTAEAVIRASYEGRIEGIKPVVVISSRPNAPGIEKARALDIPTRIVQRRRFSTSEDFGNKLLTTLREYQVDLISQNGWLPQTPKKIVDLYKESIVNQHPGRLPDFGGQGMYGARVTCATIAFFWMTGASDLSTVSTVHHVTTEYDAGDLIQVVRLNLPIPRRQEAIEELAAHSKNLIDATKEMQKLLLPIERENVISVLKHFGARDIPRPMHHTPFVAESDHGVLFQAKELAIQLFPDG